MTGILSLPDYTKQVTNAELGDNVLGVGHRFSMFLKLLEKQKQKTLKPIQHLEQVSTESKCQYSSCIPV